MESHGKKDKDAAKIPQAGKSIRAERYVDYKSLVLDTGVLCILHSVLFSGISEFYCAGVLSWSAEMFKLAMFHSFTSNLGIWSLIL